MVEVSVILPAKNEEATIGACIDAVRKVFDAHGIAGEVIVSDSSQDATPRIARKLGARVVTPDRDGYGAAYAHAFRHAAGRIIVMGDADGTYDFAELPRLLAPLQKEEASLVIGSRFKGTIEAGGMSRLHRLGNPLLTGFLNFFYKAGVSDAHSGFRAITRPALDTLELRAEGMEFASEMIVEAVKRGFQIREVPITYRRRPVANSKLSSLSDGWRHLRFMLLHAPNFLFTYPGVALLLAGGLLLLFALFRVEVGYTPGTHSAIAGSLLVVTGYQVVFFGLFARRPTPRFLSLETGATLGSALVGVGGVYVATLLWRWIRSGFQWLPLVEQSILGFTVVVLGLQTFFAAFMLSILAGRLAERRVE